MRAPNYQSQTSAPSGSQVRLVAPQTGGLGEGIARGLQAASRGIGQFADAELAIQERHNDLHARELRLELQRQAQPLLSEYSSLQGKDAIARAEPLREEIKKMRESLAAKAGNERMKMLFEQSTEDDLVRFEGQIIDYSTKAQFKMGLDVAKAELQTFQQSAALNWANPLEHERSLADIARKSAEMSDLLGEAPELAKVRALEDRSAAHMGAMAAMASDPAFLEGDMMAYFDSYEDELTVDDRNKALAALQVPIRNRWADSQFAEIASGTPPAAGADAGGGVSSSAPTGTAPRQLPVGDARVSSGYGMRTHPTKGGRKMHNGIDFAVPAGTAIKSVAEGVVSRNFWDEKGGGWVVSVKHADGTESSYLHMGSRSPLSVGDNVTRSTVIGTVGSTGASTGPHLDFRVKNAQGQWIDPEEYLKGSVPLASPDEPRQWDQASILSEIDRREAEGIYTPEQAEFVRQRAAVRIRRDEQIISARAADAKERAQAWLIDNLETFTDISQLPADIRNDFTPAQTLQFIGIASRIKAGNIRAANAASGAGSANSFLKGLKTLSPDSFIEADLAEYAPLLTPTQYAGYVTAQADMKQKREQGVLDYAPSATIKETVSRMAALDGVKHKPEQVGDIAALMEQRANIFVEQNKGKLPGKADYEDFYRYATAEVEAKRDYGLFETRSTLPRYQIEKSVERARTSVDQTRAERAAARQRSRDAEGFRSSFFRKHGRFPNQNELDAGLANLEQ